VVICFLLHATIMTSVSVNRWQEVCRRLEERDPCLTELNLYGRGIGDAGAMRIASCLKKNTSLKEINLYGNNIGDEGVIALAAGLSESTSVEIVRLGNNQIGDKGAAALGSILATNHTIRVLVLFVNGIGPVGAAAVARGLKHNTSVQKLMLNMNNLGDEGAEAFGDTLCDNRGLKQLYLSDNKIGDSGVTAIADGLICNEGALQELNLSDNEITCEGAKEMAVRLKLNNGLKSLWLSGNPILRDGVKAMIQDGLRHNFYLESIDLAPFHDQTFLRNEKEFYLTLNRSGRKILRKEKVHVCFWAYILSRVGHDPNMIFYFLVRNPDLFKREEANKGDERFDENELYLLG